MFAYLLSSTCQRFAVFRLSVYQVTSKADKDMPKSSNKCQYPINTCIIIVIFVKDASVDFTVYKIHTIIAVK